MMLQLSLSAEEAQQLINLLDLAVKSGGLQVSGPALSIAAKLSKEMNSSPEDNGQKLPPDHRQEVPHERERQEKRFSTNR